jgi:hypothetical protein
LKNIKTLTKEPRKTTRNQKKRDQIEIIEKTKKNHKLDLKDKIESNKNFDKKTKKKKKIQSRRKKSKHIVYTN